VSAAAPLEADRRELVQRALRSPRGRYSAERTSQLSGIPKSTVYDWQRNDVYRPDFFHANPMMWSYRDLVYLRLLAWLRNQGMERPVAAGRVTDVRTAVARGDNIRLLRSDGRVLLINDEVDHRFSGENVLPDLAGLLGEFDLLEPIRELGERPLWGPDLVAPSERTYISPWVMAGEPCIDETRIPTSTVWTLRTDRGLGVAQIVDLYPGLDQAAVKDAWYLEDRLRRAA
jgi:uncharacterized protein (DUF433 family)